MPALSPSPPPPPTAPPPVGVGRFWAILILDAYKGMWPYYTQDEALYNEFAEKGFCGMNPTFRDQFYHRCPSPRTPGDDVGAMVIGSIFMGLLFLVLLYLTIMAAKSRCLESRRKRLAERNCAPAAQPPSEAFTTGLPHNKIEEEITMIDEPEWMERKATDGGAVVGMGEELPIRSDSDSGSDSLYMRLYARLRAYEDEQSGKSSTELSSRDSAP